MSDHDSTKPSDGTIPKAEKTISSEEEAIVQELREAENEENPEWDGSEAEYVSDDDAEEYEIPETGIKISYVLTQDEVYKCLYHSNLIKTKGRRAVAESVILGIAAVLFFVVYFTTVSPYNGYNAVFGVICLLTIAAVWLVPHWYLSHMAHMMADGKTVETEIYPTHIDIGREDGAWTIELDGKAQIEEFDNIIMIIRSDEKAFAIPERVIEPEVFNEVTAILLSGTEPKE